MSTVKIELEKLLNSERLKKSNLEKEFRTAAEYLMLNCVLQIGNSIYRLMEIEFYYSDNNNNDGHSDPYIHYNFKTNKPQEQTKFGCWYIHGSGFDFTFGKEKATAGGILVRSICDLENGKSINLVSGPLNSRNKLAKSDKDKEVKKVFDEQLELIEFKFSDEPLTILASPRFGLNSNKDNNFYKMKYRFLATLNGKFLWPFKAKEFAARNSDLYMTHPEQFEDLFGYNILKFKK